MLDHAAISGQTSAGRYSQTLSTGNFYILLLLSGPPQEINLELGRNALLKIEETVTESPEISPRELLELQKAGLENEISVGMGIIKIEGEKISGAFCGNLSAYVLRQNQLINLFPKKDEETEPRTVQGKVISGDLVVLGTDEFFEVAGIAEVAKVTALAPAEIREALLPKIEADGKTDISALIVRIDTVQPSSQEEIGEEKVETEDKIAEETTVAPTFAQELKSPFPRFISAFSRRPHIRLRRDSPAESPQNLRRSAYLVAISLVLLVSLIAYQLRSRAIEARFTAVVAMEKQAQDAFSSAKKLSGLNDSLAREILLQTKADINSKVQTTFGKNFQADNSPEAKRAKKLLSDLDFQVGEVSHVYSPKLDLFYDFSLLKSGANVKSVSLRKGEIFALDSGNGAVYSVRSGNKSAAIVGGGDKTRGGKFIDFSGGTFYVLTGDGIYSGKKDTSGSNVTLVIKPSDKWGNITGMKSFAGNIYLLDPQNTQVWKYQGTDLGFSDIANYINRGLSLDFSKVKDFAIDGSVYVLSASGNIVKFTAGSPEDFKITGLPDQMKTSTSIFTSEETQNIYIFDSGSNTVFVIDKKGVYVAEYQLGGSTRLGENAMILADEGVRKCFLVSGGKIYAFDLR